MRRFPIRWTLPLIVGGLPVLVAALILVAAYRQVRTASIELAHQELAGALRSLTTQLTGQFRGAERLLRQVAATPSLAAFLQNPTPALGAAARATLDGALPVGGSTRLVHLLDPDGRPVPAGREAPLTFDPPTPAELSSLLPERDAAAVGALRVVGDSILYPVVAGIGGAGRLMGYLVAWQVLTLGSGESELLARMVGPGVSLYRGSPGGLWLDGRQPVAEPRWDHALLDSLQRHPGHDGATRLSIVSRIPGSPWMLGLSEPEDSVLTTPRRFLAGIGGVVVLVGLLGMTVGVLVSRRVTRPLGELARAADAMHAGQPVAHLVARPGDEPGELVGAFNRMAERVQAEVQARTDAERQWRLLFAENPHPMWVFDEETLAFLAVNETAIERYGYTREEFLAMTILHIRPPEDVPVLQAHLAEVRGAPSTPGTFRHRRKNGTELHVDVHSRTLAFDGRPARLVLAQDVTSRLALEAALRQAQKMEAIGRLAGGIAHDFNNLLAVIMTYADLARASLPPGDGRATDLGMVAGAAEKAHALTRQLLAFSRQQVIQPVILESNQVITDTAVLLRRVLGEDITVDLRLDATIGRIRIDPGQFEQVLMNLAVNARDAMPRGGRLSITTATATVDDESRLLHGLSATGRFVVISVTDTGIGITPEVRARLFEPFFTTKEVGKGTGLGLATVYGIVTQAGGCVSVYSEPGLGATFRIYLPELLDQAPPTPPGHAPAALPRGTETILLVEDDAAVRAAGTAVLERLGYRVLAARGAEDAEAIAATHGPAIALVISDVIMPETDGPTLVLRLRGRHPGMRVLLMSGYAGDVIGGRVELGPEVAFLEKPFTAGHLARKVREILGPA